MASQNGMMVLPQFQGNYYDLQRQQALAQALAGQALQSSEPQAAAPVGPYQVTPKYSPLAGLSKLGTALFAAKLGSDVASGYQDLGQQQAQAFGFPSSSSPQDNAGEQAMAIGAQNGSVGPTNANAALASKLLSNSSQSGQQSSPQMSNQSPMNPMGLPPALAYSAYASDPAKYAEIQSQMFKPAEIISQMRAAGIDSNSELGRQIGQRALAKDLYQAPTSIRGQVYSDMNGIHTLPAQAETGFQNVQGADGKWYTVPIGGGLASIKEAAAAGALGKAYGGVTSAYNGTQPTFVNTGALAEGTINGGNGVSSYIGGPQNGNSQINQGHFTGYQAPGSAVTPDLAPGVSGSINKVSGANADRYNAQINMAADSPTRQNVLDNIINLSKSGVQTGPTADWQNKAKGMVASSPVLGKLFPNWQGSVGDYQEISKYLNQNGLRAWQAAGGTGTDAQMDAAMNANPNSSMFPAALQTMAAWSKAGEQAMVARANFYQQYKNNNNGRVDNLDQADQTWRNHFDPKVFQLQTYQGPQRDALINGLSPQEAKQLMDKRAWFKQNGLLQ